MIAVAQRHASVINNSVTAPCWRVPQTQPALVPGGHKHCCTAACDHLLHLIRCEVWRGKAAVRFATRGYKAVTVAPAYEDNQSEAFSRMGWAEQVSTARERRVLRFNFHGPIAPLLCTHRPPGQPHVQMLLAAQGTVHILLLGPDLPHTESMNTAYRVSMSVTTP